MTWPAMITVVAVAVPCIAALVGLVLQDDARAMYRPRDPARPSRGMTALIVASAGVAAIAAPITAVVWVAVALNFLLGRGESVPFSTYPMFSRPGALAWALRVEDANGQLIEVGKLGLSPHVIKKQFNTEVRAALQRGTCDRTDARRAAARTFASMIEQRRPPSDSATTGLTILFIEYRLESSRVTTVVTPLLKMTRK